MGKKKIPTTYSKYLANWFNESLSGMENKRYFYVVGDRISCVDIATAAWIGELGV